MSNRTTALCAAILLGCAVQSALAADDAKPLYRLVATVPLGAPDRWDYVTFDAPSGRVYVAHMNEITIVDPDKASVIGHLTNIDGAHGVAVGDGHGFAANGRSGTVTVFDPATFMATKTLPADKDADGVFYDKPTHRVFVMDGDSGNVAAIDAVKLVSLGNISLDGKPEAATVDNKGNLYINIVDKRQIVRMNTHTLKITARWPVSDCEAPHGIAVDPATDRVFSSCENSLMVVLDAHSGRVLSEFDIGRGTDGASFDPRRKRAFSSNGAGTVTIVSERSANKFVEEPALETELGARTMDVDPKTGRLFLPTAEIQITAPPDKPGGRSHYSITPGSAKLLIYAPVN